MQRCPGPREQAGPAGIAARFAEFAKTAPGRVAPPRSLVRGEHRSAAMVTAVVARVRWELSGDRLSRVSRRAQPLTGSAEMQRAATGGGTAGIYAVHDLPRIPLLLSPDLAVVDRVCALPSVTCCARGLVRMLGAGPISERSLSATANSLAWSPRTGQSLCNTRPPTPHALRPIVRITNTPQYD
jgi:hypothetical protein